MPDLAEQLRAYVDGAVDPVSADQARARAAGRRRRGRVLVGAAVAVGVALAVGLSAVAVISDNDASVAGPPRPGLPIADVAQAPAGSHPMGVISVRTGFTTRRELAVTFGGGPIGTGPCSSTVTITVDATVSPPVIEVYGVHHDPPPTVDAGQPVVGCASSAHISTLEVALTEPLDAATLVDGATGTQLRVVDGETLLRPSSLPAGWRLLGEGGLKGGWTSRYGPDESSPGMEVTQGEPVELGYVTNDSPWALGRSVVVNGREAHFLKSVGYGYQTRILTWEVDGGRVYVRADSAAYGQDDPTMEDRILDFADRLEPG